MPISVVADGTGDRKRIRAGVSGAGRVPRSDLCTPKEVEGSGGKSVLGQGRQGGTSGRGGGDGDRTEREPAERRCDLQDHSSHRGPSPTVTRGQDRRREGRGQGPRKTPRAGRVPLPTGTETRPDLDRDVRRDVVPRVPGLDTKFRERLGVSARTPRKWSRHWTTRTRWIRTVSRPRVVGKDLLGRGRSSDIRGGDALRVFRRAPPRSKNLNRGLPGAPCPNTERVEVLVHPVTRQCRSSPKVRNETPPVTYPLSAPFTGVVSLLTPDTVLL